MIFDTCTQLSNIQQSICHHKRILTTTIAARADHRYYDLNNLSHMHGFTTSLTWHTREINSSNLTVVGSWRGYMSRSRCRFASAQLMPPPLTISCSRKSGLVLPFWCWLTRVVPDKIQEGRKTVVCLCVWNLTEAGFGFTHANISHTNTINYSRGCLNPVTSTSCTGVGISASANLESVDKFCYLLDMMSVKPPGMQASIFCACLKPE